MTDKEELGPNDIEVIIEAHIVHCEGPVRTPYVSEIRRGAGVTDRQMHQTIQDAIDDWYRSKEHVKEEDQEQTEGEGGPEGTAEAGGPQTDAGAPVTGGGTEAGDGD